MSINPVGLVRARKREEKRLKIAIACNVYNFEVPVDDEAKEKLLSKLFA